MKTAYILVGIPGSGKTTWANRRAHGSEIMVVSTDYHVEQEVIRTGKTYSEIFENYMPIAIELMLNDIRWAKENGMDIIWDQTSTTVASRIKKIRMLPEYSCIAVVFPNPPEKELQERLAARPGKVIPKDVLAKMKKDFVMPTYKEGFDEIWVME